MLPIDYIQECLNLNVKASEAHIFSYDQGPPEALKFEGDGVKWCLEQISHRKGKMKRNPLL
jgi:hypothetical protein